MRVFVSGATGFIGMQLVKRLAGMGVQVHALYRSDSKAEMIRGKGVELFKGDILDSNSLLEAMNGCQQAYHVAAFAGVWSKDPEMIERLNVEGALNVLQSATICGLSRVVVTSTAGILGPSAKNPVDENSPLPTSFFTPYEASKHKLEQRLMERIERNPEVVIVNPTRVYGPGYLSESNGVTKMMKKYIEGNWKLLPGNGKSPGNYVHVEDVVTGHLLAMEQGQPNQRYILGGENITYIELFKYIRQASGVTTKLYKVPLWLMLLVATVMKWFTFFSGRPPLIVPDLVRKFHHPWKVSSEKAIQQLGYSPMNAEEGIQHTVSWLKSNR